MPQTFRFRSTPKNGRKRDDPLIPDSEGFYFGMINDDLTNHYVFGNPFHSVFRISKGFRNIWPFSYFFRGDGTGKTEFRKREIIGLWLNLISGSRGLIINDMSFGKYTVSCAKIWKAYRLQSVHILVKWHHMYCTMLLGDEKAGISFKLLLVHKITI